jgi:undecaprenyl-diphosphatase
LNLFSAILLGLIQGLTEFLPISSSAHVQIAEQLLVLDHALTKPELTAFIATIQLGTEAAVVLFFFKDIVRILKAWIASLSLRPETKTADSRLGWLVILGSLPVVMIGLVFKDLIEGDLRSLHVIAFTLIAFGLLLGLADRISKRTRNLEQLNYPHGVLFGLGQALAVIPGVSRSGGTITVGLLLGYTREAAARFSFLLAIPAVLASGLYEFAKTYADLNSDALLATALATLVSFISGYFVIGFLLKYLSRGSYLPFVIWRVAVGVLLLVALGTGVLVD